MMFRYERVPRASKSTGTTKQRGSMQTSGLRGAQLPAALSMQDMRKLRTGCSRDTRAKREEPRENAGHVRPEEPAVAAAGDAQEKERAEARGFQIASDFIRWSKLHKRSCSSQLCCSEIAPGCCADAGGSSGHPCFRRSAPSSPMQIAHLEPPSKVKGIVCSCDPN